MSCSIKRNSKKGIVQVLNKDGKESKIFKSLASHPAISNNEVALSAYKNVYSKALKDFNENEMTLSHKVGDNNFATFKESLENAKENQQIEVGIDVGGKFTTLVSFPKTTDTNTEQGFLQANILNGNILDSRSKVGNNYKLSAFGETSSRKFASMQNIADLALPNFTIEIDEDTFTIKKVLGVSELFDKSGKKVEKTQTEIDKLSIEELKDNFENYNAIIAERLLRNNTPLTRENPINITPEIVGNEELVKKLMALLKNMGINVVGMDNYIKNYTIRNGVNPNAEALADISNQVVAILTGKETAENLLEETIHFIVEAIPRERMENILRNLHKSEEFKEHYNIQKAIYESEYSGEALENVVRKEILGKILKNALTQSEEKSETQQNFFENVKRLLSNFFQDIVNFFKPEYQIELDSLLGDVQNLIDSQDVSALHLQNFKDSDSRFYNATTQTPMTREAIKTANLLAKLEKDLNKTGKGNTLNIKELRKVQKDLEEAENIVAISKVNEIASNTVKLLEAAIEDSQAKGNNFSLSQEENVAYENLTGEVVKGLSVIKELLTDNKNSLNTTEALLLSQLNETITKIYQLEAKKKIVNDNIINRVLRERTTERGLSEKDFESMVAWHERAEKDINWGNMTFGTMTNSSDNIAQIHAMLKTAMFNRHSQLSFNETKGFQAELRKFGKDEKYISTLIKNDYFESERDVSQHEIDSQLNFFNAYNSVIKDNTLTLPQLLSARNKGELKWTDEQQNEIESKEQLENDKIDERRMIDSYYIGLESKYEEAKSAQYTKDVLRALNTQKNRIREKAKDENGRIDISNLSKKDLAQLEILDKRRKEMKSPYDAYGNIKKGLSFKTDNGKQVLTVDSQHTLETLPVESRIAIDIYELDKLNTQTTSKSGRPESFDNLILSKATKEEQVRALKLNSNIGFEQAFWDSFKTSKSMIDRLNDVVNDENEQQIEEFIEAIERLNNTEKALIRANAMANNPSEIDVENMSPVTKEALKRIAEEKEIIRDSIKVYLKDDNVSISDSEGISEYNEAWKGLMQDLDRDSAIQNQNPTETQLLKYISDVISVAKQHSTNRNSQVISDVESNVRQYAEGKTLRITKTVENALSKQGLTKEDLKDVAKRVAFLKAFAESRLLSYYKSFTPQSYLDFKADLDSDMSMEDILNKEYQYLKITPNYSFEDEDVSQINPNYIQNSKMGYRQPKKIKYENKSFTDRFGKVVRDKNGYYVSSEKNEKEFGAFKTVMNFRFKQLDKIDAGNGYNYYLQMQSRKSTIDRFYAKGGDMTQKIKDGWENLTTYTEDDQEYGDKAYGTNNKIIPKQFFAKLENQSDVTQDHFFALIMANNASNLYQARTEYYSKFMALKEIGKNRLTEGNEESSATNRFKMLDSAIDYDLFGIKKVTSTTIAGQDLGKIVDTLGAGLRFKALGGSIIIPLTAYLTGKTKQTSERLLGQYYNKDSYIRGDKEYNKQLGKAFAEAGKLHSKSELVTKGEYWQSFELEGRLYGGAYSDVKRFSAKISHILFQMANFPIYGKNMYTVLHDYRIVDGKFLKFTDFQRAELNKDYNKSKEQIKADWAKIDNTINDFHAPNESGQMVWDKTKLIQLLKDNDGNQYTEEALDYEILRVSDDVRVQIKNLNVNSDMQLSHEDRVAGERHFLIKFLMAFKGFMIPLYESRFKHTGMNPDSRQMEGGSYSGIYELGRDIIKDWRKNGGTFAQAFKNQYEGNFATQKLKIDELRAIQKTGRLTTEQEVELKILSQNLVRDMESIDLKRMHLKRLGIDMLVLQGLVGIMMVLRGFAEDDEDKSNYAIQFSALISQRLAGEVNSANLNVLSGYYDTFAAPTSGFRMLTDLTKLPKAYEKGELIHTVAKGWVPMVSAVEQMINPSDARRSMVYYNEVQANAFWSVPLYHFLNKDNSEK